MRSRSVAAVLVMLALATCAATPSKPATKGEGGWERQEGCQRMESTCAATDLPRVSDRDWSPTEVTRFLARAEKGTVAVDRTLGGTKLLSGCTLPGAYESYQGKTGGRLAATNRPLLRVEEVGPACAQGTHLVASFATQASRFEAVLLPLPCPSTTDTQPAQGCIGRGMTGAQRLQRGLSMQALLEPGHSTLAAPTAKRRDTGEWSRRTPPSLPSNPGAEGAKLSNGWLLEMWALTPDDYPATRWLNRLAGDCALGAQGAWLDSAYAWGGTQGKPRTVMLAKPDPPALEKTHLSLSACLSRPVFPHCFPQIVTIDPGCMRM